MTYIPSCCLCCSVHTGCGPCGHSAPIGFADVRGSRAFHPFYPIHTLYMGAVGVGLLLLIVDLVMMFPPTLGAPADLQEVAADVSPPWYFSAPYMFIFLLPGPVAFWSLPGGRGPVRRLSICGP